MTDEHKTPAPEQEEHQTSMGEGYSMGVNFVVTVLVATGIGFGLDKWLQTQPWIMLVFIVLGFAAAVRQIWKQMENH